MALYTAKMKLNECVQTLDIHRIECPECKKTFLINGRSKTKGVKVKCPNCGQEYINQVNKRIRLEKV